MDSQKQSTIVLDKPLMTGLFRSFRMSILPSKLIISFLALSLIFFAGWIMDLSKTVTTTPDTEGSYTELDAYITGGPEAVDLYIDKNSDNVMKRGVFSVMYNFAKERFSEALICLYDFNLRGARINISEYFSALGWALRYHPTYTIIFFLIKLAVISVAGGAMCRISALQFAKDERPGLSESLKYGMDKFKSFFTAPLIPLIIIFLTGLFISLLGLLANIPWVGELLAAIFMPLALIGGILITILIIGTIAGFNLMFPAIAYDGSDCFDALSRAFAYVFAKPWKLILYTLTAAGYGIITYSFVRFFAFALLSSTRLFLKSGIFASNTDKLDVIWPSPSFMNLLGSPNQTAGIWTESVSAFLINLFVLIIAALVTSFIISFYFSANTVIYALMRNRVDNTALDDIYTQFQENNTSPIGGESLHQ